MSNYKVKVNNEAESREVQGLFEQLGLVNKDWSDIYFPKLISNHVTGEYSDYPMTDCIINQYKELTIPQLKDLVVLKRNSIDDATHKSQSGFRWFVTSDNKIHGYSNKQWVFISDNPSDLQDLKPIIKPPKEYLRMNNDGEYVLEVTGEREAQEPHAKNWIEVPKGCDYLVSVFGVNSFIEESMIHKVKSNKSFERVLWQRHTQPEELPFVDDEPKPSKYDSSVWVSSKEQNLIFSPASISSLNDTYAEIEQVRQDNVNNPSHYSDSSIECIDAMEAMMTPEQFIGYLRGNVFKYQWRYEKKNGIEDLKKAQWYLDKLVTKVNEK